MEEVKGMRQDVKRVLGIFAAWILMTIIIGIFAPPDWKWVAWVPVAFILLAIIISSIAILLTRLGFLRPITARVNGRVYKACMFCPYNRIKENPVNKNLLMYRCAAAGLRVIYVPQKVQGWCPWKLKEVPT